MSLLGAAAITAGASAIASGGQAIATGKLNKKNREWQEKMYARQRADSLSDWNMQNAYNSPEQQMQRLKDAGLNPNLVYGDGAEAMSAQQPRESQHGNPSTTPPDFSGIGQGLMAFTDVKAKIAQTNNLEQQTRQGMAQEQNMLLDNQIKQVDVAFRAQQIAADLAIKKVQLQKEGALTEVAEKTIDAKIREAENRANLLWENIQSANYDRSSFKPAQYDNIRYDTQHKAASIQKTISDIMVNNTSMALNQALRGQAQAMAGKILSDKRTVDLNNSWLQKGVQPPSDIVEKAFYDAVTTGDPSLFYKTIELEIDKTWKQMPSKLVGNIGNAAGAAGGAYIGSGGLRKIPVKKPAQIGFKTNTNKNFKK